MRLNYEMNIARTRFWLAAVSQDLLESRGSL
jgi:hypothetical protein